MGRRMSKDLTIYGGETEPREVIDYPATLPYEVAMRVAPIKDICAAYNITKPEWDVIVKLPQFLADLKHAQRALKEEGASFRIKARMQAEELLKTSWKMIHAPTDEVPATVRADLIKFTARVAGLDGKDAGSSLGGGVAFQVNINL